MHRLTTKQLQKLTDGSTEGLLVVNKQDYREALEIVARLLFLFKRKYAKLFKEKGVTDPTRLFHLKLETSPLLGPHVWAYKTATQSFVSGQEWNINNKKK